MSHWLREDYNFSKGVWYRPYSLLNSMPVPPSPSTLKMIQINRIKMNNSKIQGQIDYLNSFLLNFQNFAKSQINLSPEQDFFTVLAKKINAGYGFFNMSDSKNITLKGDISWLDRYIKSIQDFTNIIGLYSGKEIPANIVEHIVRIGVHIENGNFYAFQNRKSQLWEDISEWMLGIAGFNAIGTGAIIDKGGKQLVQDTIAYLSSELHDKTVAAPAGGIGMSIRYTQTKSQKDNKSLEEWAKQELSKNKGGNITLGPKGYVNFSVEGDIQGFHDLVRESRHSITKKVTIKIDDSTQEYLQNFLSVQAKSGSNQSLLNNQKRDLITINILSTWDKYLATLNKFYNNFSHDEKVENGFSEKLEIYTNWIFSKNIAKTTLGKNTFFLSHYGFSTLDQYMMKNNFYFKLAPNPNSLRLLCSTVFSIEESPG